MLVATIALLNVLGVVMVLSASSVTSLVQHGSAYYYFQRQLLWTALGVVAFVLAAKVDYRTWRRVARPLLVCATVVLLAVLVPGIGIAAFGSRRWLGIGVWRFQPSELAKPAILLFVVDLLDRRRESINSWHQAIRPVVLVTSILAGLILAEPDMTSAMIVVLGANGAA